MALILKLVSFKSHLDVGRLGNSGIIENVIDNKKSVVCMSLGCVGRLGISGIIEYGTDNKTSIVCMSLGCK